MILFIATAWSAAQGGINAFNIELARAVAKAGVRVACAVTIWTSEEDEQATRDGVILIEVPADEKGWPSPDCAMLVPKKLKERGLDGAVTLWVGHDLISGPAAVRAANELGGALALIHHMAYRSYQNFGGGRDDETFANYKRQIELFSHARAHIFGVGTFLRRSATELSGREANMLVPGLPSITSGLTRAEVLELQVLSAGRFEVEAEPLKRVGAAVRGFARAIGQGRNLLPTLAYPVMTIVGVAKPDFSHELRDQADKLAGVPVNIVAAGFDTDPKIISTIAARSHLVVVPSRHEGFSLVGWEAIGAGTPLIIGRNTGLAQLLDETLRGEADGLVQILNLDGSDGDDLLIAEAILKVAKNPKDAILKACKLRDRLSAELGCTWDRTANDLLTVTMADVQRMQPSCAPRITEKTLGHFVGASEDEFPRCVELGVSAAQGSSRQSLELIVELRFGTTEFAMDGIRADIALNRAILEVKPRFARIARADRLGEGSRCVSGVQARAGGAWIISSPADQVLLGRSLGAESLCFVEHSSSEPMVIDIEVTAARSDVACTITTKKGRLSTAQQKIMAVFLKEAIWKPQTEHFVLSTATLREQHDDQ